MDSKKREKRFKCEECSSEFTTKSDLKTHKSSVHSELRPFQCEHCDLGAKVKVTLQQHYAKHFPLIYKTQSCPQCTYKCVTHQSLLRHLRVHTKEKPFGCNMCSYRTSAQSSLTVHTRTHTGEKPYKCSLCTLTFSMWSNLKRHKLFVHNKDEVNLMACGFPGCDRKFTNKVSVRTHVESFHKKETRFSCPYCQKVFYHKSSCNSHILHRHTNNRPYKCSVCEYASATSSNLRRHEVNTHGEYLAVKCPVCHRRYKNDQSLAQHHREAHSTAKGSKEPAPTWNCKEPGCTKEFKTCSGLKQHVKFFHLKQRPFKCLFCDHATTTSDNLNDHLKTHTREKPYSCNRCKRCFKSSGNLSAHTATAHSELRPFQCDLCIYRAKTKACLKQHQKIHDPIQTTFECNICKESRDSKKRTKCSFRTKRGLSFHKRKMHFNEGSFKCLPLSPGAKTKSVAFSKTEPRSNKGFHSTMDCTPCFVLLVRKKELKMDSLYKTLRTVYA